MDRLAAADWHALTQRFESEPDLFEKYYTYKLKSHLDGRSCTGTCIQGEICRMRTAYVGQPSCTFFV